MAEKFPLQVEISGRDNGATAVLRRVVRTAREQLRAVRANSTSASAAIGGITRGLGSALGTAARYGAGALAAGVAAAGAAGVSAAKNFVEVGSELDDMRQKTGVGVEQLQAWRYAMQLSGVSAETFNSGLQTFNKGLGQAKLGTGKLAAGLKKVSPELLKQLQATDGTEEALRLYLAAMEQLPDASRRAALGAIAFGGAGSDMAMAAGVGAEELARLRAEKLRDGVMSTEQAGKAAQLGDKLDVLKSKYEGVKTTIGGTVATALEPHIEALADWADKNKEIIGQKVADGVTTLGDALRSIDWEMVGDGIRVVFDGLRGMKEVALDVAEAIRLFPTEVNDMPWADSLAQSDAFIRDGSVMSMVYAQPQSGRGDFMEQVIRAQVASGVMTQQQAQVAARDWFGYGLANLGGGPGGVLGEGAVKQRAVGDGGLAERIVASAAKAPKGEVTVKLEAAPGTTATVTKDTSQGVKVQATGRRSVGARP